MKSLLNAGKTIMIATITPDKKQTDESISTCHFAQRVALVKNVAYINEELEPSIVIRRLKAEIRNLREEVKFLKGENGEDEEVSTEQMSMMENSITEYIDGHIQVLNIGAITLNKIHATFDIFKKLVLKSMTKTELESSRQNNNDLSTDTPCSDNKILSLERKLAQRDHEISLLVKMVNKGGNTTFQVGDIQNDCPRKIEPEGNEKPKSITKVTNSNIYGVPPCHDKTIMEDLQTAFNWFKEKYHGSVTINENKKILQSKYHQVSCF